MRLPVPRIRHRRTRTLASAGISVSLVLCLAAVATAAGLAGGFDHERVGQSTADGIVLPTNQRITPVGTRYLVRDGRLLSSRLSPDGGKLAALTWHDFTGFLTILDVRTGHVVQQVGRGVSGDPILGDGTVAADGPLYSADGRTLWVAQSQDLVRFTVAGDGRVSAPIIIPLSGAHGPALPSGMTLSADGAKLYVALNASNTLGVIDTATNKLVKQIPVGNAPRQVVLSGGRAFVSNEGGRRAAPGEFTNDSFGTAIVADHSTGAATTGTVSVVDLAAGHQVKSLKVGLEPTALSLNGGALFVANSNDDSVSVIDVAGEKVTQTINVNPLPGSTVGSYPNAIIMTDPHHLLVSIGRDNALAVIRYDGLRAPVRFEGLLPTDWYPVNVQLDPALHKIVVTNDKGIGTRAAPSTVTEGPGTIPRTGHNTYDDTGSVTVFSPPTDADLARFTHQVFVNNDWEHLLASTPLAHSTAAPVAIPAHLGDPSTIKHVFLIVKENRTYDQVLGDIDKGNSDPALTQFGGSVTPNEHALANTFGLFDNFYDPGTLSADGHNWLVQADANDYIEKEFGAFYRSYPAQGGDALAYQRNGFIWNAAKAVGKTVADFGEYANFFTVPATGAPTWRDWYKDALILEGKATGPLPVPLDKYKTYSDIPSLNQIIDPAYPRFDLNVPDQYRTDIWLRSFRNSEKTGKLANLNLLWLPDDHTSGVGSGDPYPTAAVADNDLAVGRMIDAISHSQFWSSSAVFVLEDDPQNGVDHVDGHRSILFVASPYAKRGIIDDTYYSQLNVVRTIEQILGVPPMNQEDRAARPMFDAFTNTPNLTPFITRPNQIPLTFGLPASPASSGVTASAALSSPDAVRLATGNPETATSAPVIPAAEQAVYQQWVTWSGHQHFNGAGASEDQANPAQLSRLDFYAATNWSTPFPGDKVILAPDQVPGWDRSAADAG